MDPAEQRANAVAMLRRAASLPRMKDGRRPPMRGEAGGVSEGERSQSVEKKEGNEISSPDDVKDANSQKTAEVTTEETTEEKVPSSSSPPVVKDTADGNNVEDEGHDGATETEKQDASEAERPTTPAQHSKRRSRSRSRSRGSKDLRKMRQLDITTAAPTAIRHPLLAEGLSDELRSPETPPLNSAQAYLMQLQLAPHLAMLSPLSPFAGLGAFPNAGSPAPPFVPTLQALQHRHLHRSNSAAARMIALNKLTANSEPLDLGNGASSPGPANDISFGPAGGARLQRNNTIATGEERVAARQHLLRRLNQRNEQTQDKSDVETTSGPEEGTAGLTQKGRRRRSRRKSGSQALVDDREFLGATAAAIAASASSATSVPAFQDMYPPLIALPPSRAPSAPLERQHTPGPPNDPASRRTPDPMARSPTPLAAAQMQTPSHYQYDSPMGDRGLVVEEEDDDPVPTPPRTSQRHLQNFGVQQRPQAGGLGDGLAAIASSSAAGPSNLGNAQPSFSRRPFDNNLHDRSRDDDGDEKVIYGADTSGLRGPGMNKSASDREISWVAEPVPVLTNSRRVVEESDREVSWVGSPGSNLTSIAERDVSWVEPSNLNGRMPFDEDEDDEGEDANDKEVENTPNNILSSQSHSRAPSPPESSQSQELLIDLEETPNHTPSDYHDPSHHSTTSTATVNTNARESAVSSHSEASAHRSDASTHAMGRTHSLAESLQGWPEMNSLPVESPVLSPKRSTDGTGSTAWSRVKGIVRSGSSLGRRSRTNSIARERERGQGRGDTESSRESAASMLSARRESRGDTAASAWQPGGTTTAQAISPSAPAALLIAPPPRTGVSPIPPASDTDAAKYANPKLFPFPGMMRLQEDNLRRGVGSASSPDVTQLSSTGAVAEGPMRSINSSNSSQALPTDQSRDRKLSHQASDSRLLQRYHTPTVSGAPSSAGAQIDYFNIPPPASNSLPFTREGVKKWLSSRLFPSASQQGATSPSIEHKSRNETTKKPSLSDLLGGKSMENIVDWGELEKPSDGARAPTSTSTNTVIAKTTSMKEATKEIEIQESSPDDPISAYQYNTVFSQSTQSRDTDIYERESRHLSVPLSSSQDPSSATPDPASSEESPSASSHRSQSSLGSLLTPLEPTTQTAQAADILQRLDQVLHADTLNRLWSSALNTPPRRLILSSPMLQVANYSTVKDRFLFLFSDLLVIAKPMLPDRDSLHDVQKIYPPDRKFIIKNVVHLKDLHLNVDRDECSQRPTSAVVAQRPEFIRDFVRDFSESADAAVSKLVDTRDPKGCVTLGKLLVQLPELDRAKLGEYLSRRTSKSILKAYIDSFGFVGINIETALRIFLLSIHIPGAGQSNLLELLLDTFAARWYEANADITAFGRDLAVRLVRAIVRLNEALHSTGNPNSAGSLPRPHVTSRDFCEAFRIHDARCLVPDSTLETIYASVRKEKLCQARNPTNGRAPHPISLKRPIPSRITYKRQSEPIVVRIPQPDPQLTVTLHGNGLSFEPAVLDFSRNAEASFRITGNAFGIHTLIMACSGPAAPNYARGAPLAVPIAVERAFMRNTFQLAFADTNKRPRRYMFSVDDPIIRLEWTTALRRQIDAVRAAAGAGAGAPPEFPRSAQVQVYRAADALSFDVLQETLLAPRVPVQDGNVSDHHLQVQRIRESYRRSASRSQVYRLGAGKNEGGVSPAPSISPSPSPSPSARKGNMDVNGDTESSRLWTGGELTTLCTQNSAIALVLSLLQAALPYDTDNVDDGSTFIGNGQSINGGLGFGPGGITNVSGSWQHQPFALSTGVPSVQRNPSQSSAYQI